MQAVMDEPAWREAIALLEADRYWDAHEALEAWWRAAEGTPRAFASGTILLCAALHKARAMGSPRGGRRNFAKALRRLAEVPDHFAGTDVRRLEAQVHAALGTEKSTIRWPLAPTERR